MSQPKEDSPSITITKPRCPACNAPVKVKDHWKDVRYFTCQCGNKFKGYVR